MSEVDRKEVKSQKIVSATGSFWIVHFYFEYNVGNLSDNKAKLLHLLAKVIKKYRFLKRSVFHKDTLDTQNAVLRNLPWLFYRKVDLFCAMSKDDIKCLIYPEKKTFSADCTSEHFECSFDITSKIFPPDGRKSSSAFTIIVKNGNFLAKIFNESYHRNTWNAVLTSLLKVFTTESETLWLKVRRWKKKFSKTLSPKCSPGLVEDNSDNPAELFLPRGKNFSLYVWNR